MTATASPASPAAPDRLHDIWASPPGILGFLSAVNHKVIGKRFIVTAFGFLLLGGVMAVLMRLQLISSTSTVLGPDAYNEAFTMHGTTMMFLFAIPMVEGLAMYFVPLMIGARDLPFSRLNAFGYWAYLAGGLLLFSSFLVGAVPDGGWFAYTPLTSTEYSPGKNLDFWLLGVTFVEISGIVGALELIAVFVRHRAPGMTLPRVPLFVWSAVVMAAMILFAMPAVVVASLLLELERSLGLPFYLPEGGGNPLLWQHLFWIFGHPEVYIIFIPATGIVSTLVPIYARRPIIGYAWIVTAQIAIGIISFGLWVHHMFTTGLPGMVQSFFAVSSALIAIPSGVQIFAWLATLWSGRPKWNTPLLFVAGFIFIFVGGGITGVMVSAAPFDWQVHDSYFVVAHFHYVILGGVVFPIFGGLHHWFPKWTGRVPGEPLGKVAFWLMLTGFNITFFPQHLLGLWGMPRRVYTYPAEAGWDGLNLLSSLGSGLLTLGILVFIVNLASALRSGEPASDDPWEGDTLEWATSSPPPPFNFRQPPLVDDLRPVRSPAPVGTDPATESALAALANPPPGVREQHVTTGVEARLVGVARLAGPSYWPLLTALAITVGLVGVLASSPVLAPLGALGTAMGLLLWLRPPVEEVSR